MTSTTLPLPAPAVADHAGRLPIIRPRGYPSDVNSIRWQLIAVLLEELDPQKPRGRQRSTSMRAVINAINYRWQTGCPWRMLPHDFPAWETVYTYFHHWEKAGLLPVIRDLILKKSVYRAVVESRNPLLSPQIKCKLRMHLQHLKSAKPSYST